MKISGFGIIRNGNFYAYPFQEAILSILPLCDEFIINVGLSDDNTLETIESIKDPKIKIIKRQWDMSFLGGKVLSVESNAALEHCTGDWCFYIQADEVLHEKYIPIVKEAINKYHNNPDVDGLRFKYRHFYGSYNFVQDNYRNWYVKEVRVIRNIPNIVSWGDAMDFKYKNGKKIRVKNVDAEIFHYGWVRPPETLIKKRKDFNKLYYEEHKASIISASYSNYDDLGNLVEFTDSHPKVMMKRINSTFWQFDAKIDEIGRAHV